ncbi:MAG: thiamine pyrophosphate-dependent dehydrogenase E1 component subunit alpha [Deltaproteobacteria bacterium]|nr:thiamine pyrophosphate-dependent dehydrogenase E1 component subunit alpha [Deltaproteobacteria bacterium]
MSLAEEKVRGLLETMVLVRRFEEKIVEVYGAQDMKSPVHLCIGQEAVAAGVCANLKPGDLQFSTHRNHGHCLARGADPAALYAEFYGRETGCCHGRGGSMHPSFPELGIPGTTAIVGGTIPLAVGAGLAFSMRGQDNLAVAFFGDGASDQGILAESVSFAVLHRLPVLFVCENNGYAVASPLSARQPDPDVSARMAGFGLPTVVEDGNNAAAVYVAAAEAAARARAGEGPTFLEFKTYRWQGHVGPECDVERGCRPAEELAAWKKRCPVALFTRALLEKGVVDEAYVKDLYEKTDQRLDKALAEARKSPFPDPADIGRGVFAETGKADS